MIKETIKVPSLGLEFSPNGVTVNTVMQDQGNFFKQSEYGISSVARYETTFVFHDGTSLTLGQDQKYELHRVVDPEPGKVYEISLVEGDGNKHMVYCVFDSIVGQNSFIPLDPDENEFLDGERSAYYFHREFELKEINNV